MLELEMGYMTAFFAVFGLILIFIVAWIFHSERTKNTFKNEAIRLRELFESAKRDSSILSEKFEDSQDSINELEALVESTRSSNTGEEQEASGELVNRFKNIESENFTLKAELDEARDSLEEVYRAIHENEE